MGSDAEDIRARENTNVPIYKEKGDTHDCGSFRGIKLMSHRAYCDALVARTIYTTQNN